jgi:hypothetical protein
VVAAGEHNLTAVFRIAYEAWSSCSPIAARGVAGAVAALVPIKRSISGRRSSNSAIPTGI